MTIPEFNTITKDIWIGKYFDEYMILYTLINSLFSVEDIVISLDSTKDNKCKFKLIPSGNISFDYIASRYNKMELSLFNRDFRITTKLKKNGIIVITVGE